MRRAGLPGKTRMNTKARNDAPMIAIAIPRSRLAIRRITALRLRVENVSDAVSDDVGGGRRDQEPQTGKESDPPLASESVVETVGDHRPPLRGRNLARRPTKPSAASVRIA